MATAEQVTRVPSRAGGTDHEYSCIHEQIGPHTVVPFKRTLIGDCHKYLIPFYGPQRRRNQFALISSWCAANSHLFHQLVSI